MPRITIDRLLQNSKRYPLDCSSLISIFDTATSFPECASKWLSVIQYVGAFIIDMPLIHVRHELREVMPCRRKQCLWDTLAAYIPKALEDYVASRISASTQILDIAVANRTCIMEGDTLQQHRPSGREAPSALVSSSEGRGDLGIVDDVLLVFLVSSTFRGLRRKIAKAIDARMRVYSCRDCRDRVESAKGGMSRSCRPGSRKVKEKKSKVIEMARSLPERGGKSAVGHTALLADDDTLAAGGAGDVLGLGPGRAVRLVRIAAARATAVELDAGARTGDAVAFAGAAGGGAGRDRGWGRRVRTAGAARAERGHVGVVVAVVLGCVLLGFLLIGDLVTGEFGGELLDGRVGESLATYGAGLVRLDRPGVIDERWGERAALGHVGLADAARMTGRLAARGLGRGDVEGVELAAGGGLDDMLAGGVMGDVVPVDDVVIPVALALLEGGAGEAELALPGADLAGVLGEG
nr:hypothetical protein CFP56_54381 [Quercus suber]